MTWIYEVERCENSYIYFAVEYLAYYLNAPDRWAHDFFQRFDKVCLKESHALRNDLMQNPPIRFRKRCTPKIWSGTRILRTRMT